MVGRIQISVKRLFALYLQTREQAARVARIIVVGAEHPGRHRLAEAAAACHAAEPLVGEKRPVYYGNQPRLIYIFAC